MPSAHRNVARLWKVPLVCEQDLAPISASMSRIRELIGALELCHHKAERWVRNIIETIGTGETAKGLGSTHPGPWATTPPPLTPRADDLTTTGRTSTTVAGLRTSRADWASRAATDSMSAPGRRTRVFHRTAGRGTGEAALDPCQHAGCECVEGQRQLRSRRSAGGVGGDQDVPESGFRACGPGHRDRSRGGRDASLAAVASRVEVAAAR